MNTGLRSDLLKLNVGTGKSWPLIFCFAVFTEIPKNSWQTSFNSITGDSKRASSAKFVFIYHLCNHLGLKQFKAITIAIKFLQRTFEQILVPIRNLCQMNYDKKIKLLRSSLELTQKDFALKLSIPLSTLKKIESGISNGLSAVEQILSNDEFVYLANWFFDPNATDTALSKKGSKSELNRSLSLGHINLPFYEVKASAGDGLLVEAERQTHLISFKPEWLNKEIGVNPNDVFLMLVDGDSMYPTLKNGAMIMVNKHFNGLSDGVYVMRHEQNLLVKRLQMLPNGIIKVKSDNALYEPWEINKENLDGTDIEIIGRVVWSGQRM